MHRRPWWQQARTLGLGGLAAGLVLGALIGAAVGRAAGADQGANDARAAQLARDKASAEAARKLLDQRSQRLDRAEKRVAARERRVGILATRIRRNTISGDGIYNVGNDIRPGTYRTRGAPGCYYAILNSPDNFDIATNNTIDGPSVVSLAAGKYFQTEGCADWTFSP